MTHKVYILRGVPGSGKSTCITNMCKTLDINTDFNLNLVVCSADHYFMQGERYIFDAKRLGQAHGACQAKFRAALEDENPSIIFVDNTNTTKRELDYYVNLAQQKGAEWKIVNVECDVELAAVRNSHGVPREKVLQMAERIKANPLPNDWPQITINN